MFLINKVRRCLRTSSTAAAVAVLLSGISAAESGNGIVTEKSGYEVRNGQIQSLPAVPDTGKAVPGNIGPSQQPQPDKITGQYIKGYFTDAGKILASPVNWDRYDWLKAGLIIGASSGLYFADTDIKNVSQRNQSSPGNIGATAGNAFGNPLYVAPSLGLFYLYGHLNDDPKARRTSLLAAESLVISGAITMVLKQATQRFRPSSGETSTTWDGPGLKSNDPSFPSIHAQTAFSVASVIAEEYGANPFVPPIAYGLATLTGFARIYDNKHWASDVFFGGAIGYFVGKTVVRYHTVQKDTSLKILPTFSQQGFGLMAEYRY
ncbi:MAG: phosphatase PAP2 family protein [Desulfuromonadaceae bacterium]